MRRETPAEVAVTRTVPGGTQTIYSCPGHRWRTIRELGRYGLEVTAADPRQHGCKGCQEDWEMTGAL